MIFNRWRRYPKRKPKYTGWYQCTVRKGVIMDLYFNVRECRWIDRRRQQVFDGYKVYKPGREPLEYNRVNTDQLCERIDVVAWKKLPKPSRLSKKEMDD